ncbi:MAG: hypothetical protein QW178_04165, partial [Candidatus Nitrosocaldus sp.]
RNGSNNNSSSSSSSSKSDSNDNSNVNTGILARITPKHIAELAVLVDSGKINRTVAKQIMQKMLSTGMLPSAIIQGMNVDMLSKKDELEGIVDRVMDEERKAVMDAISNEKILNYLLGKVMKYTNGRADPKLVLSMLKERIVDLRSSQ